jgi:hypothetical protein
VLDAASLCVAPLVMVKSGNIGDSALTPVRQTLKAEAQI